MRFLPGYFGHRSKNVCQTVKIHLLFQPDFKFGRSEDDCSSWNLRMKSWMEMCKVDKKIFSDKIGRQFKPKWRNWQTR